jgi:hypothetical protein
MKRGEVIFIGGKRIGKSLAIAETIEAFHLRERKRHLETEARITGMLAGLAFLIGFELETSWAMVIAWVLFEVALFWWAWVVVDMRPIVKRLRELEDHSQ